LIPPRSRKSVVIVFFAAAICHLQSAEVPSAGKHCLWRITNAPTPFYVLGSVHALQRSDYEGAPVIEQAIRQCQRIVFEVDPKEDALFATKLAEAARLPRGQQIRGQISPETYDYLRKITINGMSERQHLYPWAIAMFLNYQLPSPFNGTAV
jgi:uncharacterized protein YbaP (TraB family)